MSEGSVSRAGISRGQKALWFLRALAPDSGAYHVFGLVRVRETLDPNAVERSFRKLVERHAALRSTFHAPDGEPRQRMAEGAPLDFAAQDASAWSEERLKESLQEEAYRPFDLEHGPLLRVRSFATADGSTVLLVVVHHIVADFWSLGVLMTELGAVYREETGGEPARLAPLPRSFADFIEHQERELAGPSGASSWDYWRERLRGPLPALELPTDRPRPAVQTYAGGSRSLRLEAELAARLRALGRSHRATLLATLLAGFQTLLHRMTGQTDLLVGSPSTGRLSREWAGLVGYFVNPVVLRGDLSGEPTFSEHLKRVGESTREDLAHQGFPFPLLAERLQPVRDPSRSPVFQVLLALQKVPVLSDADVAGFALGEEGSRLLLGGMDFESVRFEHRTAQFDLSVLAAEGAGRTLVVSCQYNSDLFDGPTVERVLGRLGTLLRGAVADPRRPLSDLPLLTEAEQRQMLVDWNDTGTTGAAERLHEAFERQAARRPEAAALVCGDRTVSYGELDDRAGRLAAHLRSLGVSPEVAVGICLDRSVELVVAMLATLKAGGAYVPLDPAYPAERLAFLVGDAGAAVVLTRDSLRPVLPEGRFRVVALDGDGPWRQAGPIAGSAALPGNLAYLIYTSGSTGRPKGVAIEHRSASAFVRWAATVFSDDELSAVLFSTSINFDLSIFELFVTLSRGGTVVLVENALQLPRDAGVTLINTVPSALAELLRTGPLPASVRTVSLAGEPLRRSLVEQAYAGSHVERVLNLYGPSEDTTYSTWAWIEPGDPAAPTIGRPIAGTRVHLLDSALRLVPAGSVGELCLAGEGLARGYLGRPALTAERFVPDPCAAEPGARLYRTGDLARWLPDGRLELRGRLDHQVKVRGFRIELDEVGSALDRHPGLRESVVVVGQDLADERALVAYVVPAGEAVPVAELRRFLRATLPDYMVPTVFVTLEDLPRTPNGKVDRRALPRPAAARSEGSGTAPRTPSEELLAGIWCQILGREQVGTDESFFDLGGHSLTAAQVIARLSRAVGREIPLSVLFEAPTVAELAARVDRVLQGGQGGEWGAAPPLVRVRRDADLPASFGQRRLWYLHLLDPASTAYHMPAALRIRGPLSVAALESALGALVARHEALRTSFAEGPEGLVQRIAPPAPFRLVRSDLRELPEAERERAAHELAKADARRPFDLAADLPVRAALLALGDEDHLLVLTLHHIAADGWSLEVLARDLSALYEAAAAGRQPALPELPVQYADFAAWQHRWLRGEPLERGLAWWRDALRDAPVLELPADHPGPAEGAHRAAYRPLSLDASLVRRLRERSRQSGATLFMTLLAAFQTLLAQISGQEDVVVGTPVAGRSRADLEGMIGFFVNTLALRSDLSGAPPFSELLARTREAVLGSFAQAEVPFEKVVEELRVDLRVLFALQSAAAPRMVLPGLDVEVREMANREAKLDLLLSLAEKEGGLVGWIELDRDRLDPATVERWAGQWATLLESVAADPDRRVAELPRLRSSERGQVLRPEAAPRALAGPVEEQIAEIWTGALGVQPASAHESFFDLGGHSILATRVLSRVRERFAVELTLRRLFREPTVAGLARAVEEARRTADPASATPLRAVPRDREIPLSFSQERLWFLDQLRPGSAAYNLPMDLRLRGPLDGALLRQALAGIVGRHEALRTTFAATPRGPRQVIAAAAGLDLPLVDLSILPDAEREIAARDLAAAAALRPFDLAGGPLFRAALLRLGREEHVLLLDVHHIVSDGWSTGVFLRELGALYGAFVTGGPALLPELPIQPADVAVWQREHLAGEVLDRRLAGWRERLAGAPVALELPTDRPRPAAQGWRGGLHPVALPRELSAALERLGRSRGATPFMVLLAGFSALLHRLSHQEDLLVGSPVANRSHVETEALIGFFANTVVLRSDLSGNPTAGEVLARVREACLDAFADQDTPFEKLVEILAPERDLSRPPLFQVFFSLQNTPAEALRLPGIEAEAIPVDTGSAKFDLTLQLEAQDGRLAGWLEYDRDLFEEPTIRRWAGHLSTLLAGIAADPARPVAELPLLSAAERRQLLLEHNATAAPVPDGGLHERIAGLAALAPDAPALLCGDRRVSRRELDRRANGLAHRLREMGVGPEARVALALERSPEMVVALLAVLKAGGAYVPLDPDHPRERLAWMLEDSRAAVLVTEERLVDRLPPGGARTVLLDRDPAGEAEAPPVSGMQGADLAYVLYTSGSTGRPKGVQIPHSALLNFLASMAEEPGLAPEDELLAVTTLSFDIAGLEIWLPLLVGARVRLVSRDAASDPRLLAREVDRPEVTVMQATPATWRMLLDAGWSGRPGLKVLCGGEALPRELADRLIATGAAVWSLYGPTETTIWSMLQRVEPGAGPVTLGRPLANTRIHLLSRALEPVPPGVAGELWIGGAGLSRGYVGRPDLTAERFGPDPFAGLFDDAGARLYRTGDLARRRPSGEVEFLGRIDHQVKVRGFRIEPGEVEAALVAHPAVSGAVVVAQADGRGGHRLASYVVPRRTDLSAAELRTFLRERLPDYMVPSAFGFLESFPLNPNGKLDRRALPALVDDAPREGYVAPRNPVEAVLAALWEETLGIERAGVHDDFFARGGHSLLAAQLVSRVREALGVELPLRAVFEGSTLAALAAAVDALAGRDGAAAEPIPVAPRTAEMPLSYSQERLWFLEQLEPGSAFYNIPGAVRLRGPLRLDVLETCLGELVRRHEALRTTFGDQGGRPYQTVAPAAADVRLRCVDLSALTAEARETELARLATAEARRPFDLARGPLVRTVLFRLAGEDQVVVHTLHHIVSDGWSSGVLVRDLGALYGALSTGRRPSLPPLPVQYADYAVWQRQSLTGERLEPRLAYWRERLAGVTGLELPLDRPRPAYERFRGTNRTVELSASLTRDLHRLSRRHGATLFMTLLAAFQTALFRHSGQTDIPVGSPIANRNRRELEGVIGFFANTVVLRTDLGGDPTFGELLERVREVALGAYAHEDLPFERLVDEIQPERDMSRNPLFQVMLVLQNQPFSLEDLGGVRMTPWELDPGTAKFDLTVFWREAEGRLTGLVEHNTDLFDDATVLRFHRHCEALLRAAAEDPERPLLALPMLDEAERHQILEEWNAPWTGEWTEGRCVHTWVEDQVARTPAALAVVDGDRTLTYADLDARANRLARGLRRMGVGPESLVGICVERSLEMVVGMLAVLKAGGAGVALDPAYPVDRLAFIIRDARLPVLLTQTHLLRHFPEHGDIAICLDRGTEPFPEESPRGFDSGAALDNPIYAIYTSGSTGQPKGIVITHRAFSNLLAWQLAAAALRPGTRTVQFATFGFCVSFQEMFSAWCSGGVLVLADEMTRRDIDGLAAFLERERIDRLHLPFAALKHLSEAAAGQSVLPSRLREVITAGEQLQVTPAVRGLFERLPGCTLSNQYGASETHVVSALTLNGSPAGWPAIPPVGRPIDGVRIHLLDARLQPVPPGVAGELYASGACVPRCYLNDPVLTAQKLLPDPYGSVPGARLYRTGDAARYLADGRIEYHGRLDTQVKIRGFRVELGEVETTLARHPGVRDAAVVARGAAGREKRLVAYVVAAAEPAPTAEELRAYLKQRLPEYMVPAAFVPMPALPLNANGKLDQPALPEPEEMGSGASRVAPRTPVERELAGLWSEVLGLELRHVGVEDSFFESGGHSLLATQLISRIRLAFAVDLPLKTLFQRPTIAALAESIEALRAEREGRREAPALVPVPRTGRLPLSFAQRRLWLVEQLEPTGAAYNNPLLVRLSGRLRRDALQRTLSEIVRRHEVLRTSFGVDAEGEPYQRIEAPAPLALPVLDLRDLTDLAEGAEAEARRIALLEASRPFDLSRAPLLRSTLLRLGEEEHLLLVTIHHIAFDGWSLGVLTREIALLYNAFVEGGTGAASPLPELPVQYADFAAWQRSWLDGETLEDQLRFWKRHLEGAPQVLELPTDHPRPALQSYRGELQRFAMPAELSADLQELCRREGVTPFMVLLTGLYALFHLYSGQTDLVIGSPIANRNRLETEDLIGFFVNILALRTRVTGAMRFRELLHRVRDQVLEAAAHQDLPIETLVEELRPDRHLGRTPLYQVVFTMQNAPVEIRDLAGLTLSPLDVDNGTAKFDLTFNVWEMPGGFVGTVEHSADLFEASTVRRLWGSFERLLRHAAADPDVRIEALEIYSEEESLVFQTQVEVDELEVEFLL